MISSFATPYYRMMMGILVWCLSCVAIVIASQNSSSTSLRFEIVNSYSGGRSFSVGTGSQVTIGGITWVNTNAISLSLNATTSVNYAIAGDVASPVTGTLLYSGMIAVTLSWNDGVKSIDGWLLVGGEPLILPSIVLWLDRIAPTMPVLTGITDNSIISSDGVVWLQRLTAVDTGVGIAWYQIYMWLIPHLPSMVSYITTGTSLALPSELIPYGTIYWTVVAIDYLWHRSMYTMGYFHHWYSTTIEIWSNWAGQSNADTLPTVPSSSHKNQLWRNPYSTKEVDGWYDHAWLATTSTINNTDWSWYHNVAPVYYRDDIEQRTTIVGVDCGISYHGRARDAVCLAWDAHTLYQLASLSQQSFSNILSQTDTSRDVPFSNWLTKWLNISKGSDFGIMSITSVKERWDASMSSSRTALLKSYSPTSYFMPYTNDYMCSLSVQDDTSSFSWWYYHAMQCILYRSLFDVIYPNPADVMVWRLVSNVSFDQPISIYLATKRCGLFNDCGQPDPQDYESVLKQFGQNYIPRTREFSWYLGFLLTWSIGMAGRFFYGGYHHRYIIRYLK